MQMSEGLLFGQNCYVILLTVSHKLLHLFGVERAFFRPDERMALIVEHVFDVQRKQVEFERSAGSDLFLYVIERRHRTAAYVVVHAAPTNRRPVFYRYNRARRYNQSRIFATELREILHSIEQLPERLCAIEQSRASPCPDCDAIGTRDQRIAFIIKRILNLDSV